LSKLTDEGITIFEEQFDVDLGQEETIEYVKQGIEQIQNANTKEKKEYHLFQLLAFLISSSNEIAQRGDFYEAGGRLYSAAYYLEEYHPKEAMEVYSKAVEFYDKEFLNRLKEGAAHEAANIAIRIANIYRDKLHDDSKQMIYVNKAIGLIQTQIDIMQSLGSPRELGVKYQTLAMLYVRVKQWDKVIQTAKLALDLAKAIKDYSVIANAYNDISQAYELSGDSKQGQNILFEAMDYFSKEAEEHESGQDLLPLSQLYQIIKNIYGYLRDPRRFQIYSRKEAAVYIALAKLGMLNNTSNAQIASYYRGAALCYKETDQNDLDAATCFFLAGNYYYESKKYVEAGINFQDAAAIFERIKNWKKAYELYIKAGENAARAKNLEGAIENFIRAFEISQYDNLDRRKVSNLLCKFFVQMGEIQEAAANYFVAGTMQLEAAYYTYLTNRSDQPNIQKYLENAMKNYQFVTESKPGTNKKSTIAYSYCILAVIAAYLGKSELTQKILNKLTEMNTKLAEQYVILAEAIINSMQQHDPILFEDEMAKYQKLWENSDELQKLYGMIAGETM
jgi:tetratricopeptide (TPR) repeat protein